MAKTMAVGVEPFDRLEEKIKLLVSTIARLKGEHTRLTEDNGRLQRELTALQERLGQAEQAGTEVVGAARRARPHPHAGRRDSRRARHLEALGRCPMADPRVVHVEVNGQRYPIRSSLDPIYVQELASYVDRKLRIAFDSAPSSDTLGLAILAALNIADEFFRARDSQLLVDGSVAARAGELERIVDQALELADSSDRG